MFEERGAAEADSENVRSPAVMRFAVRGAAFGAFVGIVCAGVGGLRTWTVHEVPLTTFLIIYPTAGAIIGGWAGRHPHARGWKRPAGFFATEPLPAEERERRERRIRRSTWLGFGGGGMIGLAASVLDFAWRGWPGLSAMLGASLFFGPYFGALAGVNLGQRPGDPKPSARNLRFGLRTLMILTAYAAVWLALVVRTSAISGAARLYDGKGRSAREMAAVFQKLLDQSAAEVGRSTNAEELRAGRIPDGLTSEQKRFLKSLDETATEEYRRSRYGLIADGEQRRAELGVLNVKEYTRLVDYEKGLAEKYAKAAQQPWIPVAPDPPRPPSIFPANNPPPASLSGPQPRG